MEKQDIHFFMEKLKYRFKNIEYIEEAFRHSSYVNEQADDSLKDNECLEFLGDAVLNLAIGHLLMKRFPEFKEGDLSRTRANLVNESQLALIARSMDIGLHTQLGKGELQTMGREKNSILADTLEAVIAAVYLDGGFNAAFDVVETHFTEFFEKISIASANPDYKSRLQEFVQMRHHVIPYYKVINEIGPDHDKTFNVQLKVNNLKTEGTGKSKKLAEQDAARKAFEILVAETDHRMI